LEQEVQLEYGTPVTRFWNKWIRFKYFQQLHQQEVEVELNQELCTSRRIWRRWSWSTNAQPGGTGNTPPVAVHHKEIHGGGSNPGLRWLEEEVVELGSAGGSMVKLHLQVDQEEQVLQIVFQEVPVTYAGGGGGGADG
jgi:hypothetical protein